MFRFLPDLPNASLIYADSYSPIWVIVSVVIAILTAYLHSRRHLWVAVIMGGAVSGMHYTAMSAAYFVRDTVDRHIPLADLTTNALAIFIALTTVFLALTALVLTAFSTNRETTQQLRDNEQRLKIATDSGQVGIWDLDLQTNELIWDETMFALYWARKEDFSGTYDAWSTRMHPEDKSAAETALQDAISIRNTVTVLID